MCRTRRGAGNIVGMKGHSQDRGREHAVAMDGSVFAEAPDQTSQRRTERGEEPVANIKRPGDARKLGELSQPPPTRQHFPDLDKGRRARLQLAGWKAYVESSHRLLVRQAETRLRMGIGHVDKVDPLGTSLCAIMADFEPAQWAGAIVVHGEVALDHQAMMGRRARHYHVTQRIS